MPLGLPTWQLYECISPNKWNDESQVKGTFWFKVSFSSDSFIPSFFFLNSKTPKNSKDKHLA